MHLALVVDPHHFSAQTLRQAIVRTLPKGKLDIVLLELPSHFLVREHIIRTLYGIAGRAEDASTGPELVDTRIVIGVATKKWDHVLVPAGTSFLFDGPVSKIPLGNDVQDLTSVSTSSDVTDFGVGAVGGTFDHMHRGHKLLLTLAALAVRFKLIVGITGAEMLKNKKYAEVLDSYEEREEAVTTFLEYIRPGLIVEPHAIHDVYGPTATVKDIDVLIVSEETRAGARQINDLRAAKGWSKLAVVEIGLVPGDDDEKLSSTDLRKRDYERNKQNL